MSVERDLNMTGWALLLALLLLFPGYTQAQSGFRWLVEPAYDDAGAAFDGVVPLLSDGRWGLMGSDGSWRVAPRYATKLWAAQWTGMCRSRLTAHGA